MTNYTNVIYESQNVNYFTNKDDYRGVRATNDIEKGTIILVEHCLVGTPEELFDILAHDEKLYNSLSPITDKWDEQIVITKKKDYSEIKKKVETNAFGNDDWKKGISYLGCKVSSFNHTDYPNSINIWKEEYVGTISQSYVYIKTIRDISKGNEITVSHKNSFFSVMGHYHMDDTANRIIEQYCGKKEAASLLRHQELARNGLYCMNNVVVTTPRWLKKMERFLPNETDINVLVQNHIKMINDHIKITYVNEQADVILNEICK